MNVTTPKHVKELIMNEKEILHTGRNRLGFHVFLSRFILDFRMLSLYQQRMKIKKIIQINLFPSDDISIDSTSSIIDEKVHHKFVMKLACKYWSHLYNYNMKDAWKNRAIILNSRKLKGKFVSISNDITCSRRLRLVLAIFMCYYLKILSLLNFALDKFPYFYINNLY